MAAKKNPSAMRSALKVAQSESEDFLARVMSGDAFGDSDSTKVSPEAPAPKAPIPDAPLLVETASPVPQGEVLDRDAGYLPYEPTKKYGPGDRILLPIDLAVENPKNPRVFYFEEDWPSFIQSLARDGQLTAAQVYPPDSSGHFMLKSGHRRRRGLLTLGQKFLRIEVIAPSESPLDEFKQARAINLEHRAQTHFDDAIRFQELLDEHIVSDQRALAREMGVTEAELSKCLSLGKLPREIVEEMAKNISNFGLSSSHLIYRYWKKSNEDFASTQKLVAKVIEGKLSVRRLEAFVSASADNVPTTKRKAHALARAEFKGTYKGELKAYEGRITLSVENLEEANRDNLYRKILALFEEASTDAGLTVDKSTD